MALPNFSPPVPGFPVAQLTIDGLAICCFNDGSTDGGTKLWEVAYPRGLKHNLTITVEELDDEGETIPGTFIPYLVDDRVERFTISLTGGSEAHYDVYPRGGPAVPEFVRTAANNDPHDLGWMIDITGDEPGHDFRRLLPKSESNVNVTLAQLRYSFFYTRKPGDQPVRFSPVGDNDPLSMASRELGRANEEIDGLLLATEPGEITFEFEPPRSFSIHPLPYDLNRPRRYKITIINEDDAHISEPKGGFIKGDFNLFYDVTDVRGEKQDLWARPRPTTLTGTSDGDCNPVSGSGQRTLRTLIS
jgi:hypothetical protein